MKKILFLLSLFCAASSMSCAQESNITPKYDFNKHYDINEIIESFEEIERPNELELVSLIKQSALIGFSWIDSPLNKIVIFRNENTFCAIKITSFKRENDKKTATSFDSGEETFSATYKFLSKVRGEPVKKFNNKANIRDGSFVKKAAKGIGRLAFGGGDFVIKCGNQKLVWGFPTGLFILGEDKESEFALTNLEDFDLVNFHHRKYHWYGYEENRKMIQIPILK